MLTTLRKVSDINLLSVCLDKRVHFRLTLTHRDKIAAYLSSPANLQMLTEYCLRATKQYTYQRNQFINFTGAYNNRLAAAYRNFLLQLKTAIANTTSATMLAKSYAAVLKHHHEQLRLLLSTYCSTVSQTDLRQHPLLRSVPCQEYSAPFQLQMLNVNVSGLMEPILDVGCGTAGTVVNFLRNQGYAAFGIDRLAPAAPYFFQTDWLDFGYSQNSWGTILAHQSLSTHFIYNHLHLPAQAVEYARLFKKILDSLQPGGAFYYAPGLPFFEHLIEAQQYPVHRAQISMVNDTPALDSIAYAVKIEKPMSTSRPIFSDGNGVLQ